MNSAIERLLALRVEDIMNRDVVTIPVHASMADAATTLGKHEVSGAPVIDEQGRCVGILSATDFASRDRERDNVGRLPSRGDDYVLARDETYGTASIEEEIEDSVRRHMTPAVQTIDVHAPILEAARCMCGEHIHRLVVTDSTAHPVGIITSLDLVAAMIGAVEE